MKVLPLKNEETYPWILEKHYAKRIPQIIYAFGLYIENELKGIVTYGKPASPFVCIGVCGNENKDKVLELNRLCLEDNLPNQSSFLVSNSIKLLPKPSIIVSYADCGQGHIGYVYQASNFLFTGTTKERTDISADGKHPRHHKRDKTIRQHRTSKNRYVFIHANKYEKKQLLKKLLWEIEPYPKGISQKYDAGKTVKKQNLLFI